MTKDLEERTLHSILSNQLADSLPYFRSAYYLDLFPIHRAQAEWITDYVDKAGNIPSLREFKRANSKGIASRPKAPEPLVILMDDLRDELVEDIARQSAEDMSAAFDKHDMAKFAELGEEMTDKLNLVNAPIEAQLLDTDQHTGQLLAELEAGRGIGKVIPTGFEPLDRELGGGWCGGRLYTLSALVHLGKTYFTVASATHARSLGFKVLYISLEMSSSDISEMSLCLRYRLNVNEYIKREQPQDSKDNGESKEKWLKRILTQRKDLEDLDQSKGKVYVQGSDIGLNCAKNIAALAKEKDADIIFIDAAQDLQANKPINNNRTANLYMALSELNGVCTRLGIPIVNTVQLSADVEKKGLINNLSNIQWGQVFAQKSHAVIAMLGDRTSDVRDCTMEKNRAGPAGAKFEIHMRFPEVRVYATYLQAVGVILSEDDVFDDAADLAMVKNLHSQASDPSKLPPPPKITKTGRSLNKSKPVEAEEESSDYQKKTADRKIKRQLKRNKRKDQS